MWIAIAIIAFTFGLVSTINAWELLVRLLPTSYLTSAQPVTNESIVMAHETVLTEIYEKSVRSVVKLNMPNVELGEERRHHFGSGIIWDANGNIVTNAHLVRHVDEVEVTFINGEKTKATVIDRHPLADLAILRPRKPLEDAQPLPLAPSNQIKVGQLTLAIGSPYEQGFTMTRGIISARSRTVKPCKGCYPIPDMLQTDTALNPGNSGGPLLNSSGELIGINTVILGSRNLGIGFAIKAEMVKEIVDGLFEDME